MRVIFTQNEIDKVSKARKAYRIAWLISFIAYLVVTIGMFVVFGVRVNVYGDRTLQTPFTIASIALSLLFIGGSIFLFDLKYRVVNAQYKMFKSIREGDKEKNHGTVVEINKSWTQKDDVWFYSLVVECAPVRRAQQNIRHLLIEKDRPAPQLNAGDQINFIAYSNILVGYELITENKEE